MRPVFVSQPTWVPPAHRSGLDKFKNLLRVRDLDPRSIGVTDLPSQLPLDEVIQLMERCYGAIILGIPQIEVQTGKLKGDEITSPFSLGTEWNHIEAALAYSLQLPVLVIHDVTVGRGIFDRGAANAFIYAVDFPQIRGRSPTRSAVRWEPGVIDLGQSRLKGVADAPCSAGGVPLVESHVGAIDQDSASM